MEIKDIPRGNLSTIILTTLLDSDKYGYEIISAVETNTNGALSIKLPSLYSCLRRLEEQKIISSYWLDSDKGGKRHYYRLTDFGRKQTQKWQYDLAKTQTSVNMFIGKSQNPIVTDIQDEIFEQSKTKLKHNNEQNIVNKKIDNEVLDQTLTNLSQPVQNIVMQQTIFPNTPSPFVNEKEDDIENIENKLYPTFLQFDIFTKQESINTADFDSPGQYCLPSAINNPKKSNDKDDLKNNNVNTDVLNEITRLRTHKRSFADSVRESGIDYSRSTAFPPIAKVQEHSDLVEDFPVDFTEDNSQEHIDDAVFITESPAPEELPKVKKLGGVSIQEIVANAENIPNLKHIEKEPTVNELVSELYNKGKNKTTDFALGEFNNYKSLAKYFKERNIEFRPYENKVIDNRHNSGFINIGKYKLFTTSIICLFCCLIATLTFFLAKDSINSNLGFLYIICPCVFVTVFIINLIFYLKNKEKVAVKSTITFAKNFLNLFVSLLGCGVILSLNLLLLNFKFAFLEDYASSLIMPCCSLVSIPISTCISTLLKNSKMFL